MSIPVVVELAVGEGLVPLADADVVAAAAQAAGVSALRLLDAVGDLAAIDPSVVGAYLAGRHGDVGYLVDVPTTHQAPYNTARRVQSFDRATGGRVGAVLRVGAGDEVSDGAPGVLLDVTGAQRWAEYAQVLTALWESFPRAALVGDQERGLVLDDALLRPARHVGASYRVAGPLDGPASVQGRPVLVVSEVDLVGWPAVARYADVVVVDRAGTPGADDALAKVLAAAGRRRADVALLGRTPVDGSAEVADLHAWADRDRLDGVVLAPTGGTHGVLETLRTLVPLLTGGPRPTTTLRAALGLAVGVPA